MYKIEASNRFKQSLKKAGLRNEKSKIVDESMYK